MDILLAETVTVVRIVNGREESRREARVWDRERFIKARQEDGANETKQDKRGNRITYRVEIRR